MGLRVSGKKQILIDTLSDHLYLSGTCLEEHGDTASKSKAAFKSFKKRSASASSRVLKWGKKSLQQIAKQHDTPISELSHPVDLDEYEMDVTLCRNHILRRELGRTPLDYLREF